MTPITRKLGLLLLPGALALAPACGTGSAGADAGVDAPPILPPDAMPDPCIENPDLPQCKDLADLPAPYVRGSLIPAYEIMSSEDLDQFENFDINENISVTPVLADYQNANTAESEATQLQQLETQFINERTEANAALEGTEYDPLSTSIEVLPNEFAGTADQIPFRGKPTDVAFLTDADGDQDKAYIPLSGRWSVPGNEVVVVDYTNPAALDVIETIRVGVRPIAVAADPETNIIFVCNSSSNYISVIDAVNDEVVTEIRTKYACSDILAVDDQQAVGDDFETTLYVANEWLQQVLVYDIKYNQNPLSGNIDSVVAEGQILDDADLTNDNAPTRVIDGVGSNPQKLTLSQSGVDLYVSNVRGGEMAVVRDIETYSDNGDGTWNYDVRKTQISAPTVDIVDINNNTYVLTMMLDRGFPDASEQGDLPGVITGQGPAMGMGLDGQMHVVHPGASYDNTHAYNFEDIRSGILQLDATLTTNNGFVYYVDDNDSSQDGPNDFEFDADERILAGAQPRDAVTNEAQDTLWVAYDGSEIIQVFSVVGGNPNTATLTPVDVIDTHQRGVNEGIQPYALALDEASGVLLSVNRGSGTLQSIDLNGNILDTTDPFVNSNIPYPATNIEIGEYLYANAHWSNDGRKSCVSCHFDDQMDDGIPYANGATAPTVPHRVKPTWNLMDTENYFWNGSFRNNSYQSVAFAAQTKTQCEIILFGFVEGITSDPATRVGDPENNVFSADSENCAPVFGNGDFGDKLPNNFLADTAAIINDERFQNVDTSADAHIREVTQQELGVEINREEASRFSDWYGAGYRRLPPNPLAQLYLNGHLESAAQADIDAGKMLFNVTAGCAGCHVPATEYQDNKNHGPGAEWMVDFKGEFEDFLIDEFFAGGLPQTFLDAVNETADSVVEPHVINYHYPNLDFFVPFCFDDTKCLQFDDPFLVQGAERDNRTRLIAQINLVDPDRQWMPGQPLTGSAALASVNTPTLRGIWWATNYLRHGFADTITEAILAPGHPVLDVDGDGNTDFQGFAYANAANPADVHGITSQLTADQVRQLILYVRAIPAKGTLDGGAFYEQ